MANIKSAKKRVLVNAKKAARNKAAKSGVKTAVKKVYAAIEAGDKAQAACDIQGYLQEEHHFPQDCSYVQSC